MSSQDLVLTRAAKENDIGALYNSIREHPEILQNINNIPFVDTPLHVAASTGNTHFVAEIMSLMASFSRKLNCKGLSPLHLALQNGHLETARKMIQLEGGLIRVPGKGKMTPMHYLVSTSDDNDVDKLELLIDFLKACPEAIEDVTIEWKTPLHVAVESKHLMAFQVLFGWVHRTEQKDVLEKIDSSGNNVLHLAALTNQPEIVKILARYGSLRIQTNQKECTPFDIALAEHNGVQRVENEGVIEILTRYKYNRGSTLKKIKIDRLKFFRTKETSLQGFIRFLVRINKRMSMDMRNAVLVVAVLVATAAYQATLQPPGGVIQASSDDPTAKIGPIELKSEIPRHPGKVVMGKHPFSWFMFLNTLAFISAVAVILFALPIKAYSFFLHFALIFMTISYLIAIYVISNQHWVTLALTLFSFSLFAGACIERFCLFIIEWKWPHQSILNIVYGRLRMPDYLPGAFRAFHRLRLQWETVICSPALKKSEMDS